MPQSPSTSLTMTQLGAIIRKLEAYLASLPADHPDRPWTELQLDSIRVAWAIEDMRRRPGQV